MIKKMNNKTPLAIIVGAVIIAISIFIVFSNTPNAQLIKSCKKIVDQLSNVQRGTAAGEIVMTRCLNGQL